MLGRKRRNALNICIYIYTFEIFITIGVRGSNMVFLEWMNFWNCHVYLSCVLWSGEEASGNFEARE
jgi:hypothetical protein